MIMKVRNIGDSWELRLGHNGDNVPRCRGGRIRAFSRIF